MLKNLFKNKAKSITNKSFFKFKLNSRLNNFSITFQKFNYKSFSSNPKIDIYPDQIVTNLKKYLSFVPQKK